MMIPISAAFVKSRPMSSIMEVLISLQNESRFSSGTGRRVESKVRLAKVLLMSCFRSSKGVSMLE